MRFYVDVSQNMSDSILQKNHDRSFCSIIRSGDKWDFQILIEPFPVLILNINTKSNQCVSTEGIYHCSRKNYLQPTEYTTSHTRQVIYCGCKI